MTTYRNLKALSLGFSAVVALSAALGFARDVSRPEIVQSPAAMPPSEPVGPVDRTGEHGSESHFLVEVVESESTSGELEYELTLTSRFMDSERGQDENSAEPAPGAFKFAYYFACDPARAVVEPGFCDALSRDVAESDVIELGLFESFSEVIPIPDALPDGFYLLQVTAAGSSGSQGDSAVFIDQSHFFSVDGRTRPLSIHQFYAHSGANQLISDRKDRATPNVPDPIDPVVDPVQSIGILENQ